MNAPPSPVLLPPQLRVLALALVGGPLVFAVIVAILRSDAVAEGNLPGWLGTLLTGIELVLLAVACAVRARLFARVASAPASDRLRGYAAATLVFFALLEGSMLLGVVGWLLLASPVPTAVPAALAFAIAIASLPSDAQFESLKP